MSEGATNSQDLTLGDEEAYRLCTELIALGEAKAAVDCMRSRVNQARRSLPTSSLMHLRLLSQYAEILESAGAFGEAEFIRAGSIEIVESGQVTPEDAVDALLKYGLLLARNRNYNEAITQLKEAVRRAEDLDGASGLEQQVILAKAWRGLVEAFEGQGELSQATEALDVLETIKRRLRYLVFSLKR